MSAGETLIPAHHGKSPPASGSFKKLASAEQHFVDIINQYLGSYSEYERPFAARVAKSWAADWSRLPDSLPSSVVAQNGLRSLQLELLRSYSRDYYRSNSERINARHRRYHRRRKRDAAADEPDVDGQTPCQDDQHKQ